MNRHRPRAAVESADRAVHVEGAEPGDALVVRFPRVRMNRNWGWSAYRLGLYSLTPESIEGIYPNRYRPNEIIAERANVVPWDLGSAGTPAPGTQNREP